jgi:hypothetical protein
VVRLIIDKGFAMDRTTFEEYEERVDAGAELLDEKEPLWYIDVDPGTLDMSDPDKCVVGQLRPDEPYHVTLGSLGIDPYASDEVSFGFDLKMGYFSQFGHADFEILNVLWTRAIMQRRSEH